MKMLRAVIGLVVIHVSSISVHAQDTLPVITADNAAQLTELARYGDGVLTGAMAWSPDGQKLAVGSTLGVSLYEVNDFSSEPQFLDLNAHTYDVAFSPDGTRLAIALESSVQLYSFPSLILVNTFEGQESVAFSPDGERLAVGWYISDPENVGYGLEPVVRVLDLSTGNIETVVENIGLPPMRIGQLKFGSDNILLSVVSGHLGGRGCENIYLSNGLQITDIETGEAIFSATPGTTRFGFENEGSVLTLGHYFGLHSITLFDPDSQEELLSFDFGISNSEQFAFETLALSSDTRLLAASGHYLRANERLEGLTKLFDTTTGEEIAILKFAYMSHMEFNPDSTLLASFDGTDLYVWDTDTAEEIAVVTHEPITIAGEVFELDGLEINLFNSRSNTECVGDSSENTICTAQNPAGNRITYGGIPYEATIELRDSELPNEQIIFTSDLRNTLTRVAITSDGALLAFSAEHYQGCGGGFYYDAQVWNVSGSVGSATLLFTVSQLPYVGELLFSPNNHLLVATTQLDIRVWDAMNGNQLNILTSHTIELTHNDYRNRTGIYGTDITKIFFSTDGTMLLSEGKDGTVRVWGVGTQ